MQTSHPTRGLVSASSNEMAAQTEKCKNIYMSLPNLPNTRELHCAPRGADLQKEPFSILLEAQKSMATHGLRNSEGGADLKQQRHFSARLPELYPRCLPDAFDNYLIGLRSKEMLFELPPRTGDSG